MSEAVLMICLPFGDDEKIERNQIIEFSYFIKQFFKNMLCFLWKSVHRTQWKALGTCCLLYAIISSEK